MLDLVPTVSTFSIIDLTSDETLGFLFFVSIKSNPFCTSEIRTPVSFSAQRAARCALRAAARVFVGLDLIY